jgi:hypothetical protein
MNKEVLKELKAYPLSGKDILKVVQTNIIIYTNISKYAKLEDLLHKKTKSVVILYNTNDRNGQISGHWCTLFLRKSNPNDNNYNEIIFFDSLGLFPDIEHFKFIKKNNKDFFENNYDNGSTKLVRLIYESPYERFFYNNYPYQENKEGINTCGKYCVIRLLLKDYSENQFDKYLDSFDMNFDDLVTILYQMIDN